ncbi:MAG TPA: hypothetical protein VK157_06225 [Phycisphaerales bacterium]|nr:hypothetical protein [Phycisphaerales bacterium]
MQRSMKPAIALATSLCIVAGSHAQLDEANATRIELQVYDSAASAWGSSVNAGAGSRVEWRVVVSYTGSNSNVFAFGGMTYQPTFSNADNTNNANGMDQLAPWRNGGVQGSAVAGSMLTAAEGANGGALPTYGRVVFGGTAMNSSSQNVLSTFRHGGDAPQNAAPSGTWLRIAGNSVTNWPLSVLNTVVDSNAANLNNINRGVFANQQARVNPVTGLTNTFHVGGTQSLVVFRGAFIASGDTSMRDVTMSIPPYTLQRIGAVNSVDDTRFVSWQTNDFGATIRTGFTIQDAVIRLNVPAPGVAAVISCALLVAARRQRTS